MRCCVSWSPRINKRRISIDYKVNLEGVARSHRGLGRAAVTWHAMLNLTQILPNVSRLGTEPYQYLRTCSSKPYLRCLCRVKRYTAIFHMSHDLNLLCFKSSPYTNSNKLNYIVSVTIEGILATLPPVVAPSMPICPRAEGQSRSGIKSSH
jgi:hypothetical protein